MLLRLKSSLEWLEKSIKNGEPVSELPVSGTLYVICHKNDPQYHSMPDFGTIDGYIQFMRVVIDYAVKKYGEPEPEWEKRINRLRNYGNNLRDSRTHFNGFTKKEFAAYAKQISTVFDTPGEALPRLSVKQETSEDLTPFMRECIGEKNDIGFQYNPEEDGYNPEKGPDDLFMNELMHQLSNLKMEKRRENFDISYFLTDKHCHEHVLDAMNLLIQAAVYMINCRSMKENAAYQFVLYEVDTQLDAIYGIMKRTEHII